MREIAYFSEVSRDFVDAFSYYERLVSGLGAKFEAAYYRAELEIEEGIVTHRVVFKHYHRVLISKFPYAIYYRLDGPKAVIVGLLSLRRDPGRTEDILGSR